jgi:hypothetical protein
MKLRVSKPLLRLFYKLRHRRGYGIHSPFVYRLITHVIEEKRPYYAYQEIRNYLSGFPGIRKKLSKSNRLSFRLVNYFGARNILEIGSGYGINTLCLTAPSSQINCRCVELSQKKYGASRKLYADWKRRIILSTDGLPPLEDKQDCICVDLKSYPAVLPDELKTYLLEHINSQSFIIMKGIRANRRNYLLWKSMVADEKVRVSLDLFYEGILFFTPKLYKKHYKISF